MPQINEYLPETDAQGAVGGVTPNLEAVSLFGRGLEHVGAAFNEASDVIHRREAQQEVSTVYGQFAQARADWNTKLKQRLRDGSLDPDQFDQEYADFVNKAGDNLKTAEGKDFFNRQANRLGGTLMQNAITGKAAIAGAQAVDTIKQGIESHSAALMADPDQFPDSVDATEDMVQAKVKDGSITPQQAIAVRSAARKELALGAIRGWAQQDPGVDQDGNPIENRAKALLDNGAFDEHLNQADKAQMYAYARQQDNLRGVEKERQESQANRVLQAQGQDYLNKNSNRILDGSYSLKELQTAPLTFQQKELVTAKIKAQSNEHSSTEMSTYNDVHKKIITGDITDENQLVGLVKDGKLSPDSYDSLSRMIRTTPDGRMVLNQWKQIDQAAKGLEFKGLAGGQTISGQAARYNFTEEVRAVADQFVQQQKGSMRDYLANTDPKDPSSWVSILNKYKLSATDQARIGADEAMGNGPSGFVQYSNNPNGQITKKPEAPAKPPSEDMIKPGESISDWKKRMGGKKPAAPPQAPVEPEGTAPGAAAPIEGGGLFNRMSDNKTKGLSEISDAVVPTEEERKKQRERLDKNRKEMSGR